jgi:hypothetical protein
MKLFAEINYLSNQSPACNFYKKNMQSVEPASKGTIFAKVPRHQYRKKEEKIEKTPGVGDYSNKDKPFISSCER